MQTSLSWLHELVEFDLEIDELADRLTMMGTAVAWTKPLLPPAQKISVALVTACEPHPDADHLRVCQINTGEGEKTVVCGAPNVRTGLHVLWVAPGGVLADGTKIKSAKLRGVASDGMLCSEAELGISTASDTILELPPDCKVGVAADAVFDDIMVSFELTPNRPDCLSTFGIAREVGALAGKTFSWPDYDQGAPGPDLEDAIKISIEDPEGCPRYAASLIEGLTVGPSPWWLKQRLLACGMRPINNIVDVTNFVMMETGQPLHAFDYAKLDHGTIVVRASKKGESFTTLDSKSYTLPEDAVLITDGKQPIALGGVMGGMNSEVDESTVSVLLESAYFNPRRIRRTRTTLGIPSEAALRFEKGADPNMVPYALDRAAHLLASLGGGVVRKGSIDVYPQPISGRSLTLTVARTNQVLGLDLNAKDIAGYLSSIAITARADATSVEVEVPTFRPDIERPIDLVEEVARLYGYEKIPVREQGGGRLFDVPDHDATLEASIHEYFSSNGYNEAVTSSLGALPGYEIFAPDTLAVALANPLSEELTHLRTTLLADLTGVAAHNYNHRSRSWRMYTLGLIFEGTKPGVAPAETLQLGLALSGSDHPPHWGAPDRTVSWWDLKGEICNLFLRLRVPEPEFVSTQLPGLAHDTSFNICICGEQIGVAGALGPAAVSHWDIKESLWLMQVSIPALNRLRHPQAVYNPLPRYPEVLRDLALIVQEDTASGALEETIRKSAGELLTTIELFDLYRGKPLPSGTKNLAFNLRFQSPDCSLEAVSIDKIMSRVVTAVKKAHGATLRT